MVRPAGISDKIKPGGKGVKNANAKRVQMRFFVAPAGTALASL